MMFNETSHYFGNPYTSDYKTLFIYDKDVVNCILQGKRIKEPPMEEVNKNIKLFFSRLAMFVLINHNI